MARERVGLATWEELPAAEQDRLIERCIWQPAVHAAWVEERQAEEAKKMAKLRKSASGGSLSGKQLRRRKGAVGEEDEEDNDY